MKYDYPISKTISLYSGNNRPRSAITDRLKTTSSFNKTNKNHISVLNNSYSNFKKFSSMLPKTIPSNIEKEHYYMENLSLKADIKNLQNELGKLRSWQKLHDVEISKRDRELNELLKNSLAGKHSQDLSAKDTFFQNLNYSHLYRKTKEKYKQLKLNMKANEKKMSDLNCSMKFTKVNEYIIQNNIMTEELRKYKDLFVKNEQINNSQQQYLEKVFIEKQQILKNADEVKNSSIGRSLDLEQRNQYLINQNKLLNEKFLQMQNIYNSSSTGLFPTNNNYFSKNLIYDIQSFNVFIGEKKEITDFRIHSEESNDNINNRIHNLTIQNKNLESELNRIKNISKDFKLGKSVNNNLKTEEIVDDSKHKLEKSIIVEGSLKQIENQHLDDEKLTQTNLLLMKAILLSNNISFESFCSYLKSKQSANKDVNLIYISIMKYFMKLTNITDLEDLFSIHIISKGISTVYQKCESSQFNNYLKKKLFIDENKKIDNHLDIIYELKEKFPDKMKEFFYSLIQDKTNEIIKLKSFKKFLSKVSKKLHRDQFFSLIFIMKSFSPLNFSLGFYELNYKILLELFSGTEKSKIKDKIEEYNSLSPIEEDSFLNMLYSPSINLDFTEILNIFLNYKFYPFTSIHKKLKEYLNNKGLIMNKSEENTLLKAIKCGKLHERIKMYRKNILIVKKNTFEDSEDDLLFAEVVVNGNLKHSGINGLRPISSKQIMSKNYPAIQDLSDSSMLSDYNISRIKEVKQTEGIEVMNKLDKDGDEILEDI